MSHNFVSPVDCPFCSLSDADCLLVRPKVRAFYDRFPVSQGHVLIATRRHVVGWFEATLEEQHALIEAANEVRTLIEKQYAPTGWNLGVNVGQSGGQTIPHVHLHLIPRTDGDVRDPRGGVRHVIPGKGNYLSAGADLPLTPHSAPLVQGSGQVPGGDNDPLLPHLLSHLSTAVEVDIAVAFSMASGVKLVEEHLRDVISRGGRVRLLTGDYLWVTEPEALLRLLDLGPNLELRVFESGGVSFHLKSYLCVDANGNGAAFIGSSNLSRSALEHGIEWNWRIVTSRDAEGFESVRRAFARLYADPRSRAVDANWIAAYSSRRGGERRAADTVAPFEAPMAAAIPHEVQEEALAALMQTREAGNEAGLVVLATGLGKTWLSAFDSVRFGARRVLFVAHREEILDQAMRTFRAIRPSAVLGKYTGTEKVHDADVTFASVQTLGRKVHLSRFNPDAFDYVVIDEFHHASAATYRRVLDHFEPSFMLGLTATPERTDGADLLALCGENLVYRCDLVEGIRRGLLSVFDYFGVPDEVNYENIPWRNGRFDENELTNRLAVESRAANALDQLRRRGGKRTIGFCVSQRHADYMHSHFSAAGLRTAAVHSGPTSAPRADSLIRLQKGELDVLFAVDMFNEGVDVPDVDSILMLRPTESPVLFLQQLGRGLRRREGKRLKVIDYIGNHRAFLIKPKSLFQLDIRADAQLVSLFQLSDGDIARNFLPPGCSVTYDLEARRFLTELVAARVDPMNRLEGYYRDFRDRVGTRPTATEAFHDGFEPKVARVGYGSWFQFVRAMDDLTPEQDQAELLMRALLVDLEVTPMTKSYQMLVVLALLAENQLPGSLSIQQLAHRFRSIARRSAILRSEFGEVLEDEAALIELLERNPIDAWVNARGTEGRRYFSYDAGIFSCTINVPATARGEALALAAEVAEYRLAQYQSRLRRVATADRIVCRVSHSGDRPILFLPSRKSTPGIPEGWVDVSVDGIAYQANFAKIAVNVLHPNDSESNALPELLRNWYGESAGKPGTRQHAVFERAHDGYSLVRIEDEPAAGPRLWSAYLRKEGAELLGVTLQGFEAQSGIVDRPGMLLLFVTLEKQDKPENQRYEDAFANAVEFNWQSQNRNTRSSRIGQMICQSGTPQEKVHLFVRARAKNRNGRAEHFIYCGELSFISWQGDRPISVKWRLSQPVPQHLHTVLKIGRQP